MKPLLQITRDELKAMTSLELEGIARSAYSEYMRIECDGQAYISGKGDAAIRLRGLCNAASAELDRREKAA